MEARPAVLLAVRCPWNGLAKPRQASAAGNERRRVWISPVGKDASAGAGRNSRLNNTPRSGEWCPEVTRPPLMLPVYLESTRPPSLGSSHGRLSQHSRRANAPNNIDDFIPDNSESDTKMTADPIRSNPSLRCDRRIFVLMIITDEGCQPARGFSNSFSAPVRTARTK